MAGSNRIDFTIGFNIDKTGFTQLNESFDKVTALSQMPGATKQLKEAGAMAQQVGTILRESFNYDFGQINIGKFTQGLNQAGISMQQLRTGLYSAGSVGQNSFATLGSSILNTKIQIKESNSLLDQMATTMTNTVKWGIASGVFNKITQSVREAFTYVQKLDKSLNDIQIVTNKSSQDMQTFAKEANNAAKGLGKSTRDYTEASLIYYQQGLNDTEAKARTDTTLKTANVTGQSTSAVSEELTAVWNGYKVQAQDTEKYVDKLAAVAATSASDLEELSTAMSKVASSADAMGVNVDSLAAQISTIISTTRQAPETVGTALKTIYARMGDLEADGTDEFGVSLGDITSQMQSMGVNILDETGSMRDMGDVIEEVGQKWQGWSREQKQAAAIAMAGKRQYNNLFALFENWNQYNKELDVSKDSIGTLQVQQDTYMKSMVAKQQQLSTQTEAFYSALIGDGQEVNNLVDGLTELMTVVTQFTNGMGGGFESMIGYMTIIANLFKNQISKGLLKHFENKDIKNENAAIVASKADAYKEGQNLKNVSNIKLDGRNNSYYGTQVNEEGNKERTKLTNEQAGNIKKYEAEAEAAQKIDKIRKSLTEEEYNALTAQQERIGNLEKEKTILEAELPIAREKAKALFTNNGNAFHGNEKEGQLTDTSLMFTKIQEAEHSTEENLLMVIQDVTKEMQKQVDAAQRLVDVQKGKVSKETVDLANLRKEAGFSKNTIFTEKQMLKLKQEQQSALEKYIETLTKRKNKETEVNIEQNSFNQSTGNKLKNQTKADNIQGTISAVSSLAMTLGSVNSILDTIYNKDISGPEKALQIITQLGFVLPMIYSALKAVNDIDIASIGIKNKKIVATIASAVATEGETVATEKAAVAQEELNASMWSNPVVIFVAALAGLIAILAIVNKSNEEAKEKIKENNEASIELANTKQEEIDKINELNTSYEEAYNTYKKTGEGIDSLREKSRELAKSFGTEGEYLLGLVDNYALFNEEVEKLRTKKIKESLPTLQTGVDAAAENTVTEIQDEDDFDKQIKLGSVDVNFSDLNSIDDILKYYYQLNQSIHNAQENGRTDSDEYKDAIGMFAKIGEKIGEYTNQLEALVNAQTKLIIGEMPEATSDSDYEKQRKNSISKIQNSKDEDIQKSIKNYKEANKGATDQEAAEALYKENLSASGNTQNIAYEEKYQAKIGRGVAFDNALTSAYGVDNIKDIGNKNEKTKQDYRNLTVKAGTGQDQKELSLFDESGKINPLLLFSYTPDRLNEGHVTDDLKEQMSNYGYNYDAKKSQFVDKKTGQIFDSTSFQSSFGKGYKDHIDVSNLPKELKDKILANNYENTYFDEDEIRAIQDIYDNAAETKFNKEAKFFNEKDYKQNRQEVIEKLSKTGLGKVGIDNIDSIWGSQEFINEHGNDTVDEMTKAILNEVENNITEFQHNFIESAKQLADNSSSLASGVLSGDITSANIGDNDDYKALYDSADQLRALYPDIAADVDTIMNTQLTGTQEWLESLENVQDKMDEIKLSSRERDVSNLLDDVKVDLDSDDFYDQMNEITEQDYSVIVEIKSQMDDEFETASKTLSNITDQASKIGEKFIVAQEDIKGLGEAFPGILDKVTYLKDGTIKLNKEATASAMAAAKAQANATIDEAIADIQANQIKLKNKRDYYAKMLAIVNEANVSEESREKAKSKLKETIEEYNSSLDKEATDTEIENALSVTTSENDVNKQSYENYKNLAEAKVRVSANMADTIAQNWQAALKGDTSSIKTGLKDTEGYSGTEPTTTQSGKKINKDKVAKYLDNTEQSQQLAATFEKNIKAIDAAINSGNADIVSLTAQKAGAEYGLNNAAKGKGYSPKDKDDDKDLDKLTDEFDLLENINNQLEIQEKYYDRINTLVEHTYGLTKIQGIKEENKILDSQLKLYKQKDKLIQKDINRQGSKLVHYGASFGEDGTVSNHQQVWEKLKAKVNKAAAAGKETTYEKAKQDFEDYEDAYSKYNEALQEAGDNLAKQQELIYQKVENNVKAIEAEVTVKVDTGEAIRNLQEFREAMASDSDYFAKLQTNIAKGMSYTKSGEVQTYINEAQKAQKAYNKILKGGTDKTYGTDSQAAMDAYKNYTQKAMESAKSIQEAIKEYYSTMKEWMSSLKENFNDVQNKLKNITEETKYYADLLNLIHSSNKTEQAQLSTQLGNEYAESTKYYYGERDKWDQIRNDYQKQIDEEEKIRAKQEEKVRNAKTKKAKKQAKQELQTTKNSIEELEGLRDEAIKNSETAQSNAQQASLNSLKAYQDAFKYSIEAAFQDFENEMTDGKGFDWMDKLWSLDKDYINNWYDNIEKDLNLKDFTLSIDMDIDEASSDAIKEKLAQFRDEQEKQLKNQAYLSEYDFKLAKAKYNVLKKQIALQEAQDKKTSLRLRRNSQGNYTYQYASNSNDVLKAQKELNDANSDVYKLTKDQNQSAIEKSMSLIKQLSSDLKAKAESEGLENVDSLTQEQIESWMQTHVGDYYTEWKMEYDAAYDDLLQSQNDYAEAAYTIAMNQTKKTDKIWQKLSDDEKQRWIKDSLPKLGTAFTNYYSGINKNSREMEAVIKNVWKNCNTAMSNYKDGFGNLTTEIGVQIPAMNTILTTHQKKVEGIKSEWDKAVEKYDAYRKTINNNDKIKKLKESLNEVKAPIDALGTSLHNATGKVGNLQTAINKLKGKKVTVTTHYKNSYTLSVNGKKASASEYKAAIDASQKSLSKQKNGRVDAGDYIQGKGEGPNPAGVPEYDKKGNPTGTYLRTSEVDWVVMQIAQPKNKPQIAKIVNPYNNMTRWLSYSDIEKWFEGYDTGGYTGNWSSSDGKIAMLHEKELVLNKEDTANMLKIVDSVREINTQSLDLSSLIAQQIIDTLYSNMQSIKKDFTLQNQLSMKQGISNDEVTIDQNVTINADFPGVSNAQEIEKAFNSLENMATQKAYSTKRR
jgi:TP901 family phage tail tape measure protein